MKDKIKKIIKCFLLLMVCSSPLIANAQTTTDELYIDHSYTYHVATTKFADPSSWVNATESIIRRKSDNLPIYCIQAHIKLIDNSVITGYDDEQNKMLLSSLSREQIKQVELAAYYGYGYGNHTSNDWYAATQLLIWDITTTENVPFPVNAGDNTLTRIDYFDGMINEIKDLVAHHGNTVNFNNQEVNMKVGETVRITDTNNVLKDYFNVESNDSLDMTIDNNDLVITAKKAYEGSINLIAKENKNMPYLYDGANQKCISRGDPTFINGKINVKSSVLVSIDKTYGSDKSGVYKPESNATFELYDNNGKLVNTYKTDSDGKISIYLGMGTYRLHQVNGIDGYKYVSDYTFTINTSTTKEVVYLKNELITGKLEFTKTDYATGEGIPNTKIEIYDDKDQVVYEGITDENGKILIDELAKGKYYIIETESATGYLLSDEKVYFEITEDGKIVKANMTNNKIIVEVPDTYNTDYLNIGLIGLIASGVVIIVASYVKRKKK